MRSGIIGLALGLVIAAVTASHASAPAATGDDTANVNLSSTTASSARNATDEIVIARRGRGADDPAGDDRGRRHGGKGKGGKGRGGHDDGPNHDRNDDHGHHDPNHT